MQTPACITPATHQPDDHRVGVTCPPSLSTNGAMHMHIPLPLHCMLLLLQSADVWQAMYTGKLEALTASGDCKGFLP